MPILGTQCSQHRVRWIIGISDSIQCFLYQLVHLCDGLITRAPAHIRDTTVDHIDRFCSQVFTQLQVFVITGTVGCSVSPDIPEVFALGNVTQRLFPDRKSPCCVSFNESTSGETYEARLQLGNGFHNVLPLSVRASFPGFREQRYDIQPERLTTV